LGDSFWGIIGIEIGRNMDELDKLKMQETASFAYEKVLEAFFVNFGISVNMIISSDLLFFI
tara:strand:+ start:2526 stop:2708 length:183 start_codon:yes stop_codon:yes gene_type:complete